jgi:hypothetical protein
MLAIRLLVQHSRAGRQPPALAATAWCFMGHFANSPTASEAPVVCEQDSTPVPVFRVTLRRRA